MKLRFVSFSSSPQHGLFLNKGPLKLRAWALVSICGLLPACDNGNRPNAEQGTSSGSASSSMSSIDPGSTSEDETSPGGAEENSTNSDSDSSSSSDVENGPTPKAPIIVVQDQVKLCGAIRWTLDRFDEAFASKNQLILQGGRYPANAFELHGKLRFKELEASVDSDPTEVFVDSPGKSHALAALDKAQIRIREDKIAKLTLRLTAVQDGNFKTFTIDDFGTLESELDYKSLSLVSETNLDIFSGYKGSVFGPCKTPNIKSDIFRFELEKGDWIEFETKTRLSMFDIPSQHGLTIRAHGKVKGVAFDVSEWEDLVYGAKEFTDFPQPPSLGVRFTEKEDICGIGLKADFSNEKIPYEAQILDCDLKMVEEVKILATEYPEHFEIP